jgi:hypothetical protein
MEKQEKQEEKTALEVDVESLEILQGFGEKINVFTGMKDGKAQSKAYHIAPVPIKDVPELTKLIMNFQKAAERVEGGNGGFTMKDCSNGAKMIMMGLKKTMPDIEEDEVMENFSFGTMIRTSQILIDLNDLGTQVDSEGNVVENPTKPIRRATPN